MGDLGFGVRGAGFRGSRTEVSDGILEQSSLVGVRNEANGKRGSGAEPWKLRLNIFHVVKAVFLAYCV